MSSISRNVLTPARRARIAFMRFGLGPKPGGAARIGISTTSAQAACLKELENPAAVLIPDDKVLAVSTEDGNALVPLTYERCCRYSQYLQYPDKTIRKPWVPEIGYAETTARMVKQLEPEVGFVERLVMFWMNHFNVYGKNTHVSGTVGHFERTVIRKHVLGRFSDMLKAAMTHPAMIVYLDNHISMGPNSRVAKDAAARRVTMGLNMNLAREILELHTVGVGAGYTQDDVFNLARIITGWTVYPRTGQTLPGQFYFDPAGHEPDNGAGFRVMGRSFPHDPANGMKQGFAVLDMLASHRKTAEFIAFKLVLHFVTDRPPPTLVKALASVFLSSGGNLKAVASALIRHRLSWELPMERLRQPQVWAASAMRALSVTPQSIARRSTEFCNMLGAMNNGIWGRITPDGFPDENYNWETANGLRVRKDAAGRFLDHFYTTQPAPQEKISVTAQSLFGADLSKASLEAIRLYENGTMNNPRWAAAMLLVTPEFLRR